MKGWNYTISFFHFWSCNKLYITVHWILLICSLTGDFSHFNYTYLRNAFHTALLNKLESRLGPSFKKVKVKCYSEHKQGFYVYAKPNNCNPKTVTKYIGRYIGRPVIVTSRIDNYDGENVTFHYNRYEDNKYVEETILAMEFIKRLILHIPEKYFKMIRYGGLYTRLCIPDIVKLTPNSIMLFPKKNILSFTVLMNGVPPFSSFGYDPLECPYCKHKMVILELYYNQQRVSLEEMYEKVISKSRGKRSDA